MNIMINSKYILSLIMLTGLNLFGQINADSISPMPIDYGFIEWKEYVGKTVNPYKPLNSVDFQKDSTEKISSLFYQNNWEKIEAELNSEIKYINSSTNQSTKTGEITPYLNSINCIKMVIPDAMILTIFPATMGWTLAFVNDNDTTWKRMTVQLGRKKGKTDKDFNYITY